MDYSSLFDDEGGCGCGDAPAAPAEGEASEEASE